MTPKNRYRKRIDELERRIEDLEDELGYFDDDDDEEDDDY